MKDYCVYMHYRENGDKKFPFYIGIGSKKRSLRNEGRNNLWSKIYSKYGKEVVYFIESCSREEAFVFEKMLICKYGKISDGTGYLSNLTDGGESGKTRSVICDGTLYSSLSSAASELNLCGPEAISQRIKSPHYNYHYVGEDNNYNPSLKKKCEQIPIVAGGIEYKSISDCARAYNMSVAGIRTRIKSPRFDFKEKGTIGNYNSKLHENGFAKPVIINDLFFKSISDAAIYLNKSVTSVFRLVNSNNNKFRYATKKEIHNSSSGY